MIVSKMKSDLAVIGFYHQAKFYILKTVDVRLLTNRQTDEQMDECMKCTHWTTTVNTSDIHTCPQSITTFESVYSLLQRVNKSM